MPKIVQIAPKAITIGQEDGSMFEVRPADVNFVPHVGDEVQVFHNETRMLVTKADKNGASAANGINIQIQNGASPVYYGNGNKKPVNKVAYCLFAVFLGGIGIHKFYAGKIAWGIVYIVFCWTFIPAIAAFIEFIIALCKPSDGNGMILV